MYLDVLTIQNKTLLVSQNHALFDEHFPQFSVLPGAFSIVSCIDGIKKMLNTAFAKSYQLQKIQKVSFLKPILPGECLMLRLIKVTDDSEDKAVIFSLEDKNNQSYLKGMLLFGESA